jgi:hypothetical protein
MTLLTMEDKKLLKKATSLMEGLETLGVMRD